MQLRVVLCDGAENAIVPFPRPRQNRRVAFRQTHDLGKMPLIVQRQDRFKGHYFHTPYEAFVALTAVDRDLLRRCLHHEPGSWNDFVDRFLGLVYHVIGHTADQRSFPLTAEDTEDIAAQVMLQVVDNDYAVLRQFRGNSSLATYLTVVARRTAVNELARRASLLPGRSTSSVQTHEPEGDEPPPGSALETTEEVSKLLKKLPEKDRSVVQLYFLEGKSYEEIGKELEIPLNSIGPILSRARRKLRVDIANPPPEIQPRERTVEE